MLITKTLTIFGIKLFMLERWPAESHKLENTKKKEQPKKV